MYVHPAPQPAHARRSHQQQEHCGAACLADHLSLVIVAGGCCWCVI